MKTTVVIPDSLFGQAKRLASRERTTLRALLEEGLRKVVRERSRSGSFHLECASVEGKGLQPGVRGASWEQIRQLAYEDRGG